jgi:DNA polymerase IV
LAQPLDFEDDVTPSASFADLGTSLTEADSEINKGFQCMLKNDGKTEDTNPNAFTMGVLQEMASFYDRTGDRWRTLSYR